jgi:hypothetical protein
MRKWQGLFRCHIGLLLGLLFIASVGAVGPAGNKDAVIERLREDLKYIAGDECEGRGIYTKGLDKAAIYIAGQFEKAGLKPGGVKNSYFQPFTITSGGGKVEVGTLVLKGPLGQTINLDQKRHFVVLDTSGDGQVTAPVVFAGYGITAPDAKYDDYKDIDVSGKVVVVLRKTPRWASKDAPFGGSVGKRNMYALINNKFARAEINKAAAVILVNDASEKADKLDAFGEMGRGFTTSPSAIPTIHLQRDVLNQMLQSALGQSLSDIEKAIDRDLRPQSAELKGWKITLQTKVAKKIANVKNVIAVVPGHGPLAKEYVVIGAHYDHLGYGEPGTRAKKEDQKKIHHGADDNGSGSTAVMELARRFSQMKDREGRTLVFMTFSGEEKGLLGSRFYCNTQPLFPLADTAAMVNLDMVGRMAKDKKTGKGKLIAEGTGTAKGFDDLIEKFNKKYDFQLTKRKGGGPYSDHDSFYQKKIPIVFLWTDTHEDYHLPTDTWDKINYPDMARIVDLTEEIITHLSAAKQRPEYVAVKPETPVTGPIKIPKMGFTPGSYSDTNGVLVNAVADGGPAAKGGIKAGDRIVAINNQPVTTMGTYMLIMQNQKSGQPINVTVQRGDQKVMLKVTPQ